MSRSTFKILFYANKGKEKDGIVPIMGRITINGTQSQFSCKPFVKRIARHSPPFPVFGRRHAFVELLKKRLKEDCSVNPSR